MKIFPRPESVGCLNVEDVTHSNKAFSEPNEVGDFSNLATDLGEIRLRILSIVDEKYLGRVVDCSDDRYVGTEVGFEEVNVVTREKAVTS